jgi:holo-[acyl-carrier protein] synthase
MAEAIERSGARFLDRLFDAEEQAWSLAQSSPVEAFARLFAVKEACAKALGTGITARVRWHDFHPQLERLTAVLSGGARRRARRLSAGADVSCELTIFDVADAVAATVILHHVARAEYESPCPRLDVSGASIERRRRI